MPADRLAQKWQKLLESLCREDEKILRHFCRQWQDSGNLQFYSLLEWQQEQLGRLVQIIKAFSCQQELTKLLTLILDQAIATTRAERGFIITAEKTAVVIARNFDKEWIHTPAFKISHTLAKEVLSSGQAFITANAQEDLQMQNSNSARELGLRSIVCLPLCSQKYTIGALYLDNRFCPDAFASHHLFWLEAFADQAALAMHQAQLLAVLKQRDQELIRLSQNRNGKTIPSSENIRQIEQQLTGIYRFGPLISCSDNMQQLFSMAERAARSEIPILITGESGTGKSMLAQVIHQHSPRCQGQFICENCSAIADTLLESELFGCVRGAFTGAEQNRQGLLQLADQGTLFLDEVGDMSLAMQSKLLRVLETGQLRPLGSQKWQKITIRLISATNRDLQEMVANKEFREDLWYRLQVVPLTIPPLRDRRNDIPLIANDFLSRYPEAQNKQITTIDPEAMASLMAYPWPGNIRQLEQELKKIIALKEQNRKIVVSDLSVEITNPEQQPISSSLSLKEATRRFQHNYVMQILKITQNKTEAAKILGISRRSLYNKFLIKDLPIAEHE